MEIDIRTRERQEVTRVRFAGTHRAGGGLQGQADEVRKRSHGGIDVGESATDDYVSIYSAIDARNLIDALQYAIDNGWVE